MLPEILGELGWNTYMVGKWHLCPDDEMNLASTRRNWPTGRGFERWYGFLGAETNQWYPDLVYDNHPVDQPKTPEEGYHLTEDLTDKAIEFIQRRQGDRPGEAVLPVLRAGRLPRAAPRPEGVDRQVQGSSSTWATRRCASRRWPGRRRWASSRPTPSCRRSTRSARPRPAPDPDGQPFPPLDETLPWDSLSADEQALVRPDGRGVRRVPRPRRPPDRPAARLPGGVRPAREHAGHRRVRQRRQRRGRPERVGQRDEVRQRHPRRPSRPTWRCSTSWASPKTYNHYPNGWAMAFNTPFKMWKRYEFNGGTCDPCIISWPAGTTARGEIRDQYHHAIDIVPTILDVLGVEAPATIKGHTQSPFDGVSMRYSFDDADAAVDTRDAVLLDARLPRHLARRLEGHHHPPDAQRLEPLQRRRLGAVPRRRRPLRAARPGRRAPRAGCASWSTCGTPRPAPTARSRSTTAPRSRSSSRRGPVLSPPRDRYIYFPDAAEIPESQAVNVRNRSFTIGALVDIPAPGAQGVLFAHGSPFGGHALYVKDNRLHYVYNFVGMTEQQVVATDDSRPARTSSCRRRSTRTAKTRPASPPGILSLYHGDTQGRRGPHQDPARQVLARRRGPVHRPRQRRRRHHRLPRRAPVAVHRRHDPPRRRRRQRRARTSTSNARRPPC